MSEKPTSSGRHEPSDAERARARALFVRRLVLAELLARPGQGPLARPLAPRPLVRVAPPARDDTTEKLP